MVFEVFEPRVLAWAMRCRLSMPSMMSVLRVAQVSTIEGKLTEATSQIQTLTREKEEVVAMLNAQYSVQAELQEQVAAVRAKEAVSRASATAVHEELQSKVPCLWWRVKLARIELIHSHGLPFRHCLACSQATPDCQH